MNQRIVRVNYTNIQPRGPCYDFTLPKLTFMMPDRGEVEFRDDVYDGAPLPSDCGGYTSGFSRGRRWHATDGSGTIYVTDVDNGASGRFPDLTGVVITGDGTRFYLNAGGGCYLIVDRNGNKISVTENGIVDSLGRTTTIRSNVPDPDNPSENLAVLVTVTGYGSQPRYYKVKSGIMNEHYRSDINPSLPVITGSYDPMSYGYSSWWPATATKLFTLSYGLFAQQIDERPVIYEVVLPDQRSLRFNYNAYGEVAEVQMPTGGKVWYDYASRSLPSGNSPIWETTGDYHTSVQQVDRAVIRRRTFPDGNTLEGTWNYGYSDASAVVTASAPDGTLLLNQAHFFLPSGRYTDSPYGGSAHTGTYYSLWSTGTEWRNETRDANGVVLAAVEQDWTQRAPVSWPVYAQEQPANDNRVNQARRFLDDGSFARQDTFYDNVNYPRANNVAEVWEYDYAQSLKRRTTTTYVTGAYQNDDSIHLLSLPLAQSVLDQNGNQAAQTSYEYDVYSGDGNHAPLTDYGAVVGHDPNYNGGRTTRGNLTAIGLWLNTTNSMIYSYSRYDILGNVVGTKDARGNVTNVSFVDDFGDGSAPGAGAQGTFGATYALPTLVTSPPPNPGEAVHTAYSQYDFSTGLLTGFRDRNGMVTQTIYNDPFNRTTMVKSGLGISGVEHHTAMYYAPATVFGVALDKNDVFSAKDQSTLDDAVLRSWTRTDGFGRIVEAWSKDPQGDVNVLTRYDALGRPTQLSNPYRPSAGETPVFTTSAHDLAGRVVSVTTPDNAVASSAFSGNRVLETDPAGKQRITKTNASARLEEVWEVTTADGATESLSFPNHPEVTSGYRTSYSYDTLDNLTTVNQGNRTRTFIYNSLSRLQSAQNPESGITTFAYDPNGNLLTKVDARSITTSYVYDALNRLKSRDYSDSTPDATYLYDSIGNGKGRVASISSSVSTYSHSGYDAMGRVLGATQTMGTQNYSINYSYNLVGQVKTIGYPSGHSVVYNYDSAGRLGDKDAQNLAFIGTLGDGMSRIYSRGLNYSSFGGVTIEQFGTQTPLYHKMQYNIRGQLWDVRVSTAPDVNGTWNRGCLQFFYDNSGGYGTSGPENNGNVLKSWHYVPMDEQSTTWAIHRDTYAYDSLNRIASVSETFVSPTEAENQKFVQTYSYDRYGNRTINNGATWGTGINNTAFELDPSGNNRLLAPGDAGLAENSRRMQYDAAGNLEIDTYTGQGARSFDAENRITVSPGAAASYAYDPNGRRVKRVIGSTETWQIYGVDGALLAEYAATAAPSSPQKEYGYRNGELLVTASATNGWGAPPTLDDNPLNPPGQPKTDVKAIHITQLRTAIDAVRSHYNLSSYPWQKPASTNGAINNTVLISWEPIDEMRAALDQALGQPSTGYTGGLAFAQPVLAVHIQELRDRVLGAWQNGGGQVNLRWLVTDQLGTPRMILDQTGALANVSRHDYLPFGEELSSLVGGRTTGQGYTASDGVRQKFTSKERDVETGLDYFFARFYASAHGRFISADYIEGNPATFLNSSDRSPGLPYGTLLNPQTLNLYIYAYNNPLSFVDPDGHKPKQGKIREPILDSAGKKTGYTMRVEGGTMDSPNIHVFDRRGREVGRFSLKPEDVGWKNAEKLPARIQELVKLFAERKWGANNVATGVPGSAYAESYYARQAAKAEAESGAANSGRSARLGRNLSRAVTALFVIQLALDLYSQSYSSEHYGHYYELTGRLVVTNLALAARNLPRGTAIEHNGIRFINTGKSWIDPICGAKLVDDNGKAKIIGGC